MIIIKDLCKKYLNSNKYAVHNLNITVNDGEIFGFLGLNGAGKSTTIKCLTGIYPFDSGSITVCGYDIVKDSLKAKMNMGYVPDNHSVYEKLTGREYVNYVADLYRVPVEDREKRLNKFLELFRLKDAVDKQIRGYSHGMKQKICVIAALIHNPKAWILDEPMMGLDPQSIAQIINYMKKHVEEGNTVFFSSHNIDMVSKLCNRVAIINSGELCEILDLNEGDNRQNLEKIFMNYTMTNEDADLCNL
jgi:ABC-2 type transport system ATP-binding protein